MWLKNCCSIFPALCFSLKVFTADFAETARFFHFCFFCFFFSFSLLCTWLSFCFAKSWSFNCFSSTNCRRLIIPGQTSEWRPRGTTRRADPRSEPEHPTHHTPDRGLGAPQLLRCQGRLSQQPGPVCLVTLGWSAHQRRRWVFTARACLFLLCVGSLPLKSVRFTVIWLLVLSPGFLPVLCWQ